MKITFTFDEDKFDEMMNGAEFKKIMKGSMLDFIQAEMNRIGMFKHMQADVLTVMMICCGGDFLVPMEKLHKQELSELLEMTVDVLDEMVR